MAPNEYYASTLEEVCMMLAAYNEREYNDWRRTRKIIWHFLLPHIKESERETEFELFPLPGDPTQEELEAIKLKDIGTKEKFIDDVMMAKDEYIEELRAGKVLSNK